MSRTNGQSLSTKHNPMARTYWIVLHWNLAASMDVMEVWDRCVGLR